MNKCNVCLLQDDSDIDYEELKNLPILQEDDDAFVDSIYMLRTTDADNNFSNVLMNLTSASSSSSNAVAETKKRIKAPESLRSPLTPWRDPVENWRALVTEDVLDELGTHDEFSAQHRSANNQNHHRTPGSKMPNRRHTMTFADLNRVSSTLASINIFSGFGSGNGSTGAKIQQQKSLTSHSESREFASDSSCKKVSNSWQIAKSRLTTPVYLKSGPGYDDFGFVSTQELIKVREASSCLNSLVSCLCLCPC